MTIKVEREALLRLLASPPLAPPIQCQGRFDYVSIRKPALEEAYLLGKLRESSSRDDDSVCTYSTASVSSDTSTDDEDFDRRVSFADPLVTEEWTREFTSKDDIPHLYYSTEETQRFRQEYRLERKLLSDLAIDPEDLPVSNKLFPDLINAKCQAQGRHQISRVLVLHNEKLETFFNMEEAVAPCDSEDSDDFFDNESFWSGNLTWF